MGAKWEAGRRWVEVDVEVPGTPDAVWAAVATGPGISAWFVPTEFEFAADGIPTRVVSHFSPDGSMDAVANVTGWDPPRRLTAESRDLGPEAPVVTTDWIVEERPQGCLVRVIHRIEAESDQWDKSLEMWESGWPDFFRILRLYLTHFAGEPSAAFQQMAVATEPADVVWRTLTHELGLTAATSGDMIRTRDGVPQLAGHVDSAGDGQLLLRLEEPAPGIAHLFAFPMGGQVYVTLRGYLYGNEAPEIASREETAWKEWLGRHVPSQGESA